MLSIFDFARDLNFLGVSFRLILAMICGGLIGLEREYKRRPAGFRTHILICLGAAITNMTNLYLFLKLNLFTDISRFGAQVIAGIGFIGAGTIIVTRRQKIKGLTTAAGLWVSAIIGLVVGAGYYELALFATAMVLISELLLVRLERRFARSAKDISLYVEYAHADVIEEIIRLLKSEQVKLSNLEISRVGEKAGQRYCAMLTLSGGRKASGEQLANRISSLPDVVSVEEL